MWLSLVPLLSQVQVRKWIRKFALKVANLDELKGTSIDAFEHGTSVCSKPASPMSHETKVLEEDSVETVHPGTTLPNPRYESPGSIHSEETMCSRLQAAGGGINSDASVVYSVDPELFAACELLLLSKGSVND